MKKNGFGKGKKGERKAKEKPALPVAPVKQSEENDILNLK